ncbi:DUF2487 family protein [Bacillus sp. AFS088145]|uniref:DUF2487 family protein n=1 Tax=Bacillus sp. AFS088145 TaxID=2033514 RepID=UPI000BF7A861|nr:DUF2487 family protein [Bacillus sp. AFS088145]PFH82121.1 hypothetical protein COI44_21805 [Bacillus sp. AFS088145]
MKWTTNELNQVIEYLEYIDTIIIPLCPVSLKKENIGLAEQREDLIILTSELERTYKGRVVIAPEFTYLPEESNKISRLKAWNEEFKASGIKHVFYLTCDFDWRQLEAEMDESLIWLPNLNINSLDESSQRVIVDKQLSHINALFSKIWG